MPATNLEVKLRLTFKYQGAALSDDEECKTDTRRRIRIVNDVFLRPNKIIKLQEMLSNDNDTIWQRMLDNFPANEEHTWGSTNVVLQNDTKNAIELLFKLRIIVK